jgi:hypothetical protein
LDKNCSAASGGVSNPELRNEIAKAQAKKYQDTATKDFCFCSKRILESVVQLISLLFYPYYFTVFCFFVKGGV